MIHIKKTLLTLVALLAVTTQAWATGPEKVTQFTKELIADWKDVDVNVTLDDMQKIGLEATDATTAQAWTDVPANGQAYLFFNFQGGKITYVFFENGHVKDVPSDFITKKQIYDIVKGGMMCFYTGAPPTPFPITWSAATRNTASIAAMPAGNVEVNVEYYPQAALTTVPSAKIGVKATTDDELIEAGIVAAIGSTETKQGTLLYHFSYTKLSDAALEFLTDADWSTDVPKATNITEAGTYYVYYYVKGNVGQTDETIFSDGDYNDQQTGNAPIAVSVGAAPLYTLTLKPTPVEKVTVTVDGNAVTPNAKGKIEDLMRNQKVMLTAAPGYKFRNVVVKKNATLKDATKEGIVTRIYFNNGEINRYVDFTYSNGSFTRTGGSSDYNFPGSWTMTSANGILTMTATYTIYSNTWLNLVCTFNTENNKYTASNTGTWPYSFVGIEVDGTEITVTEDN